MIKTFTTQQLKSRLDKIFSEYIRRSNANHEGNVKCYTCGKIMFWKYSHCGHFVSRQNLSTRFDERNCRPQCPSCNLYGGGQVPIFAENLIQELGEGIVNELYREARKITKDFPFLEKINYYQKLVNEL